MTKDEEAKSFESVKLLAEMHQDLCVAMQAAWIEWKHGGGAEAGMQWIENTLDGPGLIPKADAPYGKEAQAWMDSQRTHPMPLCACGRPSNIGWMGQGFCCDAHYRAAYKASLN